MKYPHTVKIERVTYSDDGRGGRTEDSTTTLYEGKAQVDDRSDLKALRDAGLEAKAFADVFVPKKSDLDGVKKRDRLTWEDESLTGIVYALDRIDYSLRVAFDE